VPNRDESSATLTPADKLPLLPGKIASETESSVNSQAESTQLSPLAASVDSNSGGESLLPPATIPESATETVGSPPADDGESAAATSEVTAPALLTKDRFEFENRRVTVSESSAIATLVLRRLGDPRGETTVSWWTVEETAVADEDYANFGVLVETFGDGEEVREIYIPLVVDSIAERTERFHVELSYDSMSADRAGRRAEIIIVDDDS
jgi:hypothetical protein